MNQIEIIIESLNKLLQEDNVHAISGKFDLIARSIRKENLQIQILPCEQFYLTADEDLQAVLELKENAWAENNFAAVAYYRQEEVRLLNEKGYTQDDILRWEPSSFSYDNKVIIAYLNNTKQQALIQNLIEGYNIATQKV